MDKQDLQLGKVDGRIPILQVDPGVKKKYESSKMVLKLQLGSRLECKMVETCWLAVK